VIDLITEPHWFANTMLMACISTTRQGIFFLMVLDEEEGEVDDLGLSNTSLIVVDALLAGLDVGGG